MSRVTWNSNQMQTYLCLIMWLLYYWRLYHQSHMFFPPFAFKVNLVILAIFRNFLHFSQSFLSTLVPCVLCSSIMVVIFWFLVNFVQIQLWKRIKLKSIASNCSQLNCGKFQSKNAMGVVIMGVRVGGKRKTKFS